MEYLGAWGTLIHKKNLKSKISCQTPFNSCARGLGRTHLYNKNREIGLIAVSFKGVVCVCFSYFTQLFCRILFLYKASGEDN
jgi:hypothetical protein